MTIKNTHPLTICLSANTSWYLYNFRRNLIKRLLQSGHSVVTISPHDLFLSKLKELGCNTHTILIANKGTNPFLDIWVLIQYLYYYWRIRPNITSHFTIKPVIYGSLASLLLSIKTTNTITGLGSSFSSGLFINRLIRFLLKLPLRKSQVVFFQNKSDRALFLSYGLVAEDRTLLVHGSGVDLERFSFSPFPENQKTQFVLVARMLWDKGIKEYVEAARILQMKKINATFQLVGPTGHDGRLDIPVETIQKWVREGVIEYHDMVEDIRCTLIGSCCVVLPSYREGLSRILMEACAIGRPIVTTDVPGCRDVVTDNYNGFLCQPKDSASLASMLERFVNLPASEKIQMGVNSRDLSVKKFDERKVIEAYLREFDRLNPKS